MHALPYALSNAATHKQLIEHLSTKMLSFIDTHLKVREEKTGKKFHGQVNHKIHQFKPLLLYAIGFFPWAELKR